MVKSLPIVCDLAGAILLFAFVRRRLGDAAAALVAGIYALNPAVLVNGAAWGQADSVLALLLMFTCLAAIGRDWRAAFPLFAAAALVKPRRSCSRRSAAYGCLDACWKSRSRRTGHDSGNQSVWALDWRCS